MHFVRTAILIVTLFTASVVAQKPDSESASRISPAQAEELFKSVGEIMQFASADTGLPIRRQVKRELASREDVEKYLEQKLAEDEDQKRFERSELIIKKLGLLPRDFALRPFMIKLLREQVAGYYDPKDKTVHLLNWIGPEAQRPVIAHELTHALQDQSVDLEQWEKDARSKAHKNSDSENADIELDEVSTARSAVIEGQGMAVLLDYILKPANRTLLDSPQFIELFMQSMSTTGSGEPSLLDSAPVLLRESLIFPYRDGLKFVYELLKSGGKQMAFAGALHNPPTSSHEILTPSAYLRHQTILPLHMPDLKSALGTQFEKYDVGSMGQFDVNLLFKQFSSTGVSNIASEWRGGMYYSAIPTGTKQPGTADLGLFYVSRWTSAALAQKFALFYTAALKERFKSVKAEGDHWITEEGPVIVVPDGDFVLITETFDTKTSEKLRALVLKEQNQGMPKTQAQRPDLSLRLVAPIFALRERLGLF